jgi:uncharacterized protein
MEKLESLSKNYYGNNDPGHDWNHILRVKYLACKMQKELKANELILMSSVFLHDLIVLPKNHPDSSLSSIKAAEEANILLKQCHFLPQDISRILRVIEEHSYSRGESPSSLEAEILQDADRLDALGAIGVLRCASVSTTMKGLFYHEEDPWGKKRELNDRKYMLDHYSLKLFKLPETMNTDWAKDEAFKRVSFMRDFLAQLKNEMG